MENILCPNFTDIFTVHVGALVHYLPQLVEHCFSDKVLGSVPWKQTY